jgi:uncharacterized phage-like protein YoqJ
MITQNSIMVTAHRDLTPEDHIIIQTTMAAKVASPVDVIYFGGAFGGDTVALEAALNFKKNDKPELVVVLPKTLKDHRDDLHEIIKKADRLVELKLSRKIHADIWWEHDKWMIDNSQKCLAFWDGIEYGGTFNAMKYAERQGRIIDVVKISGRNK